jgi:hypothetical protein
MTEGERVMYLCIKTKHILLPIENECNLSGVGNGVGEAYEGISTVVFDILQAEFGTAPGIDKSEKVRCSSAVFLRCLEAGMQVSPVTMSCPSLRTVAPPCLPLGYKRLTEGGHEAF